MKKLLVVLLFALVGAGIGYAFTQKKLALNSSGDITSTIISHLESASIPEQKFFDSLNDTTTAGGVITADGIKPLIEHFEAVATHIKSAALWKKLNLDSLTAHEIKQLENTLMEKGQDVDIDQGLALLMTIWKNFDHVAFAVAQPTSAPPYIPPVLIQVVLRDAETSKQLEQWILPKLRSLPKSSPLTVKFQSNRRIDFNVRNPSENSSGKALEGSFVFQERNIIFTLGAADESYFTAGAGASHLTAATDWTSLASGAVADSALFAFLRYEKIINAIGKIPTQASSDTFKSVKIFLDKSLGDYRTQSLGLSFSPTLRSKQCTELLPDSDAVKLLASSYQESTASGEDSLLKLIGPRTTFAFRFSWRGLQATLETIRMAIRKQAQNASDTTGYARFDAQLEKLLVTLKELKLQQLGVLTNAPISSFIPEIGVYLKLESGVALQTVAEEINKIISITAPPEIAPQFKATFIDGAVPEIQLTSGAGGRVTIREIAPHTFLATQSPALIDEAKKILDSSKSFLTAEKLQQLHFSASLPKSDQYFYVSASSVIPLLQQTVPLLSMGRPDLKITDVEVGELISLFDFNVLYAQSTSISGPLLCSEGTGVVF